MMKRMPRTTNPYLVPLILGLLFCAGSALAGAPTEFTSIANPDNRHNLSQGASGTIKAAPGAEGTDQVCIFCHTPHGAAAEGPLWNRPDPAGPFKLYGEDTNTPLAIKGDLPGKENPGATALTKYTKTDPTVTYPNGASRLCLSCHDGVTAVNVLQDGTAIAMVGDVVLPASATIDLSTSHPISFVYSDAVVTGVINPARATALYPTPYVEPSNFDSTVDTPLDSESRMQCTTCHDPHIDRSLEDGALPPFWRQTTAIAPDDPVTAVCNQCHQGPPFSIPSPSPHP